MFNSNLSPAFLILMIACLLHALVEASPIKTHLGKAVHHGNISSTVPLYYGENPSPVYFTVTKQKREEIRDASPEALKVILEDLTTSVDCASNFFKQNRPSDAIHILATSHIMDVNGAFADAGKKILAKNATLKKSADDMFSKLNITFPDENTKHQMFVAFSVGGVKAGGVTIKGMMTRDVFEQNNVLKYTFKAYDMAERYLELNQVKDINDGFTKALKGLMDPALAIGVIVLQTGLVLTAFSFIFKYFSAFDVMVLKGLSYVIVVLLALLQLFLFADVNVTGSMFNDTGEDLKLLSVYTTDHMKTPPAVTVPKISSMSYLNENNELVKGKGHGMTIFVSEKALSTSFNAKGAVTYGSSDGSKTYISAWASDILGTKSYCNVAFSGTGKELVKKIGSSGSVTKTFKGRTGKCSVEKVDSGSFNVLYSFF